MAGYGADSAPSRPFSAPGQYPGPARSQELQRGIDGDPDNTASVTSQPAATLTQNSLQFNSLVPGGVRPTSVLQPIQRNPGGNGMSAGDAARRFADGTPMG